MLKFSFGNSKIKELARYLNLPLKSVVAFDLPAGYTCPMASLCKSFANRKTGKITDGKDMKYRCYAASNEAAFPPARSLRWHNFDLLKGKTTDEMAALIQASLPAGVKVIRIHSSGDFFSLDYFHAWFEVAQNNPEIKFFGYTKIMPYVSMPKPDNFRLVYSFGGKLDRFLTPDVPVAYVVNTSADGLERGLKVACQANPSDDFDMVMAGESFALALHGTQPRGAQALTA